MGRIERARSGRVPSGRRRRPRKAPRAARGSGARVSEAEVEHQRLALLRHEVRLAEPEAGFELADLVLDRANDAGVLGQIVVELEGVEITGARLPDERLEAEETEAV